MTSENAATSFRRQLGSNDNKPQNDTGPTCPMAKPIAEPPDPSSNRLPDPSSNRPAAPPERKKMRGGVGSGESTLNKAVGGDEVKIRAQEAHSELQNDFVGHIVESSREPLVLSVHFI
jgi:hypothetical protein